MGPFQLCPGFHGEERLADMHICFGGHHLPADGALLVPCWAWCGRPCHPCMGGGNKSGRTSPGDHSFLLHRLSRWAGGARSLGAPAASLPGRLASGSGGMERVRKDYEQMRRVLLGREPAGAPVAILRAASANPTDGARAAGGYSLAALVAAAASTGSMPTTLRLFAVKADGMYPAAPKCLVCGRCVCLHAHLALSAFWLAGIAPRTTPSRHRFADVPACAICILAG